VAGYSSPIIGMRKALDLYANLRPIVSVPVRTSRPDVDLLIVRENTEGLYVKRERLEDDGNRAVAERVITRSASTRIARMAFEQAQRRGGKGLVTVVHKANVLSLSDGLFREAALAVANDFPDVEVEEQLVDSMLYRLIREPERYDVVVAPNLYGDILSDGAAALVGGLGLASSANVGEKFVVAEPVHGSAPDIAGRGIANPMATVLAAAQLLDFLGEVGAAMRMRAAVYAVLAEGAPLTPDLGGSATTAAVSDAIIAALGAVEPIAQ
jgi:homoisocitrate dehydrogenase